MIDSGAKIRGFAHSTNPIAKRLLISFETAILRFTFGILEN